MVSAHFQHPRIKLMLKAVSTSLDCIKNLASFYNLK